MKQVSLLPARLEELIPEDHLVRVVNRMVDSIDIRPLLVQYKGGGTSSYHPRMMMKVLVYAYTEKVFSSRRIADFETAIGPIYAWSSVGITIFAWHATPT